MKITQQILSELNQADIVDVYSYKDTLIYINHTDEDAIRNLIQLRYPSFSQTRVIHNEEELYCV